MPEQKKEGAPQPKRPSVLEDKEEFIKDRVPHMGDKPNMKAGEKGQAGKEQKK